MPVEIRCPKCGSENVRFSKKHSRYNCEDCAHEFVLEKPFVSKRIFISYGHDEHASLAVRLRDDLRTRGHDVWFDAERLRPGHDWEAFIENGLEHLAADKANSAVLLLLTPHSVRRPDGYCLNEIARALGRGLRIIPLMVVESEPPLSICRIQWLDLRECIPIHEKETVYRPRFERLLKALEEGALDFEGTQQRLLKALQPLEFDADILQHVPKFTGRKWVFDALQRWLTEPIKHRVFWICGGPGVGKTALSALLSSRYLEVAALHLCKFGHAQKSDPRHVVTSIVYQLSTQLPDYEARLAAMDVEQLAQDDARTMFDNLLVQPLAKLNPPKRAIVILIDALDEAASGEKNTLADFIGSEFKRTPDWLRLVITSRPEPAVTCALQAYNPFILDTETEANRADIRDYLRRELAPLLRVRIDAERIVEQILTRSEGVFLYVERVCHDLQKGYLSLGRLDQFPQGLGGVFWQYFERQFPDVEKFRRDVRPALRAVLAAREPMPVAMIQQEAGWKEHETSDSTEVRRPCVWKRDELHDFIRSLGSLFPMTTEQGEEVIKPYHKALADWLGDKSKAGAYFVSAPDGDDLLAGACWNEFQRDTTVMSAYSLRYAVHHLRIAGRAEDAKIIWEDEKFRRRRIEMGILNLFLVGAWRDDSQFTTRLRDDLKAQRFTLVGPSSESFSSRSSEAAFIQEVDDAIRDCDSLIMVVSPKTVNSNYAQHEWRQAVELSKRIFPLLRMGDWSLVPDELKLLQCEDFRDDARYEIQLARFSKILRRPEPELAALVGVPNLPSGFVPRPELVSRVKHLLLADLQRPVVVTGAAARVGIHGLGGIGKSVLAAALARDQDLRRAFPDGIIWVSVSQQQDLVRLQRTVVSHLGGNDAFETEVQGQGELRQLLAQKAVLLILDDVSQIRHVQLFDDLGPRCRTLVTTRDPSILETFNSPSVPISFFSENEALQLLADISGVLRDELPQEAREIVRALECFPLAVALCGAYVKQQGCQWSDYLARYRQALNESHGGTGTRSESLRTSLQRSLDSFSVLEQRRLAELCLATSDGAVSEAAVCDLWIRTGDLPRDAALALLTRFQEHRLVAAEVEAQQRRIRIHRLVQMFLRQLNGEQSK